MFSNAFCWSFVTGTKSRKRERNREAGRRWTSRMSRYNCRTKHSGKWWGIVRCCRRCERLKSSDLVWIGSNHFWAPNKGEKEIIFGSFECYCDQINRWMQTQPRLIHFNGSELSDIVIRRRNEIACDKEIHWRAMNCASPSAEHRKVNCAFRSLVSVKLNQTFLLEELLPSVVASLLFRFIGISFASA